jgi:outer membrane PBP1 activator LpoA protein
MIMDSGDYNDFNTAYRSAVRAGAELLIGPLAPEILQNWQPEPGFTVPQLALSWLPQPIPSAADPAPATAVATPPAPATATTPIPAPVQLDLAPEDEAGQLARLAFAGGARNALIVRPEGDWGDRVSDQLIGTWRELSGEIRAISVYSGQSDYSSSLKSALKLAESEARAARLRRLLAEPTEFNPRRRQDLDVIFMLSEQPRQARSLKPLLAFHYAGDLPVYSTSHIFSGRRDSQRDRDLNGIHLLETPWLLHPEAPLPAALAQGGSDGELADMYALGVDAFMLNWRLAQLRQTADARIRGYTGLLNMDVSGRVHRELVPASIREGVPAATGR